MYKKGRMAGGRRGKGGKGCVEKGLLQASVARHKGVYLGMYVYFLV